MKRTIMACLLTVSLVAAGSVCLAADQPAGGATSSAKSTTKVKYMPFRGKVASIDKTARTLTLAGKAKSRTFQLTSETRVHNDGQPAALEDVRAGAMVGGRARETAAGGWEVVVLNLGIKAAKDKAKAKDTEAESEESTE